MNTNSDNIQVTVWCLAYNHEKYIRKALEGFVSQKTNFKYEVIVHDDASTDKTVSIIKEFEEKYPEIIKPIYQKENQLQKGIDKMQDFLFPNAKGKYIAFCEGDDYWCDDQKLQTQYDIMQNNDDVVLCTHKVQCVNEDDSINDRVIPEKSYQLSNSQKISQTLFAELLFIKNGYPFHTSSYFIKKSLLDSSEFKELYNYLNGDQRILHAALAHGNIYYLNETLSHRRLLTIGNWNQRFNAMNAERKISHFLKQIHGEMIFDKLTLSKFHHQISHTVFRITTGLSISYGSKKIHPYLKTIEENYNIKAVKSYELKSKYLLMKYTPFLFDLIYKIKNMIVN